MNINKKQGGCQTNADGVVHVKFVRTIAVCNASVPAGRTRAGVSVLAGETLAVQTVFQSLQQICRAPRTGIVAYQEREKWLFRRLQISLTTSM